jgi:hypothetical protein
VLDLGPALVTLLLSCKQHPGYGPVISKHPAAYTSVPCPASNIVKHEHPSKQEHLRQCPAALTPCCFVPRRWLCPAHSHGNNTANTSSQPTTTHTSTQAAYSREGGYAGYAKADVTQSTVNLVTCVLGAGALGYPFCFKECGLVLATVIMFVTLVATRISYQLLLHCAQLSTCRTYEGIAESALGRGGRTLLEFCIAAMNLGALVAFLDILADVLSAVAGTIIPPGAEPSRHAYITGMVAVGTQSVAGIAGCERSCCMQCWCHLASTCSVTGVHAGSSGFTRTPAPLCVGPHTLTCCMLLRATSRADLGMWPFCCLPSCCLLDAQV